VRVACLLLLLLLHVLVAHGRRAVLRCPTAYHRARLHGLIVHTARPMVLKIVLGGVRPAVIHLLLRRRLLHAPHLRHRHAVVAAWLVVVVLLGVARMPRVRVVVLPGLPVLLHRL